MYDLLARNQEVVKKGLHHCKPLFLLARPAGIEPTTPWFVVIQGVINQLILLVANARRASFRPYRSTSFSRKVAQKSRTQVRESRRRALAHHFESASFDRNADC